MAERPTTTPEAMHPHPAAESSMVAWFRSEDANPDWRSVVGGWQGRVTKGSITRKVEAGHGAGIPVTYLAGNTAAGYDFGKIMKPDNTICSVTRYTGGHRKRILQTNPPNWLHGHWHGRVGVAHYNTWQVHESSGPSTDWLVMCGNSQGVVFRGRERRNVGQHPARKVDYDFHVYINEGTAEYSDFAVMEVIVWNRALSEGEMWGSMEYLNWKLQEASCSSALRNLPDCCAQAHLVLPHPADESSMVAWFKSEDANPDWRSVVGGWQGRVTKGSITRKVEAGHGARTPVAYLAGNTATGYDFGRIMKPDNTICSVTRYTGGHRNRILQNVHPNWLHGHWGGRVGVAHYNTWQVHESSGPLTDWLVMCGNSQGVVFRGRERRNVGQRPARKIDHDFHVYINEGYTAEVSDFGVMEVIVWNRALTEDEMWDSMEYLNQKLDGSQR